MMNRFFGPFVGGRPAVGLLVVRIFFGLGMALHGFSKLQGGVFHWADKMGIPAPLQALAVLGEFGGGLGMMFGLLTPLAMLGVIITMLVAIFKVLLPHGATFIGGGAGPSYEAAWGYLVPALGLLIAGPGALSLDALLFGRRTGEAGYVTDGTRAER